MLVSTNRNVVIMIIIAVIALYLVIAMGYTSTQDDERIIFLLPKVELHAHLHGSIRLSTLVELAKQQSIGMDHIDMKQVNLEEGFKLFDIVHKVISRVEILRKLFSEVVHDYMVENTMYLELRTTPRPLADGTTAEQYVRELVEMTVRHNEAHGDRMLIRLILSIDRGKPFTQAADILSIAISSKHTHNSPIMGLDFSGNPFGVSFSEFVHLFQRARNEGLKVTVHTAEIGDLAINALTNEDETTSILKFRPDRIGHALFLQDEHLLELMRLKHQQLGPPIEVCPTSNFHTLGLKSFSEHPLLPLLRSSSYPVSVNTDDRGIFNTSLTEEWIIVKNALELDLASVVHMIDSSISHAFVCDQEKALLKDRFRASIERMLEDHSQLNGVVGLKAALNNKYYSTMLDNSYFIYNY